MKLDRIVGRMVALSCALILASLGCDNDDPAVIFDPNAAGASKPTIASVDPPTAAVAGVTRIRISGANFGETVSENSVFFNTVAGTVLQASPTELVVVSPILVRDSLTIRVSVQSAFETVEYGPYDLEPVFVPYLTESGRIRAIALDKDEILYAAPSRAVVFKAPDAAPTSYATLSYVRPSQMRIGPGGFLYMQRNNNDRLFRIPPGGGAEELVLRFPERVFFFDFDANDNLYAGGEKGMFVVQANGNVVTTGLYLDLEASAVRVYDGYVYVAGQAASGWGVWRNQILASDGSLSAPESFYDWANAPSDFASVGINDLTFADDGTMYVAADKDSDPILVVNTDQSTEVLYEGVLNFPVRDFEWGNTDALYVNHDNETLGVSRIEIGKQGAPYLGR